MLLIGGVCSGFCSVSSIQKTADAMLPNKQIIWLALTFSLLPVMLRACDVPVFRYALERWPAAAYNLTAFTGGSLSTGEAGAARSCGEFFNGQDLWTNLQFKLDSTAADRQKRLALSYRLTRDRRLDIWSGPLTEANVRRVADSPARDKIARALLGGQSAVWVLLECGDADRDRAAAALLEGELKKLENTLTLPEAVSASTPGDLPELEIGFSMLRVSRLDPDEQVLVNMLSATEPDLGDYADQPMAFPVFGRGRVLYALVGDGIDRENIYEACAFLVGPCACEIKDLTPGMDLLISADWQSALEHSWVNAVDPLPLAGLGALVGRDDGGDRHGISGPLLAILAAVAAVLAVVAVVSIRIIRSGRSK